MTFLAVIAVIIAIAAWLGAVNNRRFRTARRQEFLRSFGQVPDKKMAAERFHHVPSYYVRHKTAHDIDDITWNDLEIDEIYHRMDSTRSAAGEEYLYAVLRSPALSASEQMIDEDAVDYFLTTADDSESSCTAAASAGTAPGRKERPSAGSAEMETRGSRALVTKQREETRLSMQAALADLGHTGRFSVYDYLDRLGELGRRSNVHHYVCLALPFVCIGIMFLNVGAGVVLLVAVLIYNMVSYLREKAQIEPYLVSFRYLLRLLRCGERLSAVMQNSNAALSSSLHKDLQDIDRVTRSLSGFRRGSAIVMSESGTGNPLDIVLDYIRMLFHLDLMKFNSMLSDVQKHQDDIDSLVGKIGKLDTEIAIASYRRSLPWYCRPVFLTAAPSSDVSGGKASPENGAQQKEDEGMPASGKEYRFAAVALYHPLLKNPVPNDLATDRAVLLTGSNASGKSTFLKSAALAALLGQTIGTVCAKHYCGLRFRIYSSMALRDSIREGDSYFMVEIKSLKRIVDAANDPAYDTSHPVLCFIDEVLRGTNTIERIAASSEVLDHLAQTGALCFAATHDIELADLLAKRYVNYHFEEELKTDQETGRQDVMFSYRIHPGKAATRNAIRLLDAVGFDAGLTRAAQARAEHFDQTGAWQ